MEKSPAREARDARGPLHTLDGVLATVPLAERTQGRPSVAEVEAAERDLAERFPEPFRRILLAYGPLAAVLPRGSHSLYSPREVVAQTREARAMSVSPAQRGLLAATVFVQHIDDWTSDRIGLTEDGCVVLQTDKGLTVLDETFDARLRDLVVGEMPMGLKEALAAPERALHLRFEGNVPHAVGTLANLEILDVWPKDGRLPPSAGNLLRLRKLVVHGVPLDEIPEEVLSLPRLRTISVYSGGTAGRKGDSTIKVQPAIVEALLGGFAKSNAARETRALHFSLLLGRWDRVRALATGTRLAEAKKSNVAAVRAAADRVLSETAPKKAQPAPLADAAKVDPDLIERLRELLASPDAGNQRLAIGMLEAGGVPDGMLEEILMFTFESGAAWAKVPVDAKARDDMRKVLAEISPKAIDALKRVAEARSARRAARRLARTSQRSGLRRTAQSTP